MKRIVIVVFFLIGCTKSYAQLDFEVITGTSLNMSIKTKYVSNPNGPISTSMINFPGGGLDIGLGCRFRITPNWSLGLAVEYQFKANESNFKEPPFYPHNIKNQFHILVIPFDIAYSFKNKIGIHLGAELASLLHPKAKNNAIHYQDKVMGAALGGISYTKGRFRVELLYKHYFNYYSKQTIYFNIGQHEPLVEHSIFNRFHDIQLRIAVRLFSVH